MTTLGGTCDIEDIKIPQPSKRLKLNTYGESSDIDSPMLPLMTGKGLKPVSGESSDINSPTTGKGLKPVSGKSKFRLEDLKLLKLEDRIPSTGIECWKPPPGWEPPPAWKSLPSDPGSPIRGNPLKDPRVIENINKFMARIKKMKKPIEDKPPIVQNVDENNKQRKLKFSKLALDHYNSTTEGPKFELVEFLACNAISVCGIWYHICFTAKPIHVAADSTDPGTKYFFAELGYPFGREKSIFCCVVDPNLPGTLGSCKSCYRNKKVLHPKDGFEVGN